MKPLHRLLATVAVLSGLLAGCHTMDPYRAPTGAPSAAQGAPDARPDLPGVPTRPGDGVWHMEQFLRAHFPADRQVTVRLTPLVDPFLGVTHYDAPGWRAGEGDPDGPLVIEIRDDLIGWQQRDVLIHEYAHVLAWDAPESPHGPVWAAYFGLIYKATRNEE